MRAIIGILVVGFCAIGSSAEAGEIPNRLIDYPAFQAQVKQVASWRPQRRVTEEQFNELAADRSTIVLDARSKQKFDLLHIKGAKNLSLPDFTAAELAKIIPTKSTPVLIYCNNNFLNSPDALPTKAPAASLNIYTINSLATYGYTNVYELGPLIDVRYAKVKLEGTQARVDKPEHR